MIADLRFALRLLRQSPVFACVAVVSLALTIGANTALFSVIHTLLLKSLPYKDADRLVYVTEYWPHEPVVPGPPQPDFANWRAESKLLDGIAAYSGVAESLNLTGVGEPERIQRTLVTAGLLDLIGTRLAVGRKKRTAQVVRRSSFSATHSGTGSSAHRRMSSARRFAWMEPSAS